MTVRALRQSSPGQTAPGQPPPAETRTRARRWRLRLLVIGVAVVLGVCAILGALGWRASGHLMYGPPAHYAWNLADYPGLARVAEPLTVRSSTGVTLVGRFFPGRRTATIVLSHGYGGNENEILPVANMLHAAGFTVVTYNERGRDGSGGQGTWGALETKDLRSVIDTVVRHPHVNPSDVAEFGFSIGADISILEAATDRRVKAVVAVASWPTLDWYMQPKLSDVVLHPSTPYSPLALWFLELRTGADLGQVRPVAAIGKISPRPILLMQGLADTDVHPHAAVINFDHARAPKQLWLVKGEGHEAMVSPGGAATSPRVAAFFTRALLRPRG
jgi:alpha-beta hydrolase superfamily lysophospholipase